MAISLPDWTRPHYESPQGRQAAGRPFLHFAVYGAFAEMPPLSASKYRTTGVPAGMSLTRLNDEERIERYAGFQDGWLWKKMAERDPALAARILAAPDCLVLRGEIEDSPNLNYLRDSVGLITYFLDHQGVALFDSQRFEWWTPPNWRKRVFQPAAVVPGEHVVILVSPEGDLDRQWYHTRGLRKFGRPDLSLRHVPLKLSGPVNELFQRFIDFQALGGVIAEGQEIRMRGLPEGMFCRHGGDVEDPEFNNVHVDLGSASMVSYFRQ